MLATSFSGELTTENVAGKGMDEQFIEDARFLTKDEIKSNTVYPEMLEDVFWDDVGAGFPSTRYLGVSRSLTKT